MKKIFMLMLLTFMLVACGESDNRSQKIDENEQSLSEEVDSPIKQEDEANEIVEEEIDEAVQNENNEDKNEEIEAVSVDKGLLSVDITLPAMMFESEEDIKESIAEAKADGIEEVVRNEDGSLTYKMSKSTHHEIMNGMESSLEETIHELINSEEYPSIQNITSNPTFTEFTITVDRAIFEDSFDGIAALGLVFGAMFYQLFDGVDPENYEVTIYFEDEETGEVFDTIHYPEVFEK